MLTKCFPPFSLWDSICIESVQTLQILCSFFSEMCKLLLMSSSEFYNFNSGCFHYKSPIRPAQVGCMRQVLGAGALGRPRGMGWGGRWKEGSGWGTHVNPWLIHVNVWHKPLQYCKVISLQLIKINEKKKKAPLGSTWWLYSYLQIWVFFTD